MMLGRKTAFFAALLLGFAGAHAQVEFVAGAPQMAEAGTAFRVEFTLSVNDRDLTPSGFAPPDFAELNVIAGPSESRGQNISVINGRRSETYTFTYTYVVSASQQGRVALAPASVTVDGKKYATRPVQIEIVAGGAGASAGPDPAGQGQAQTSGTLAKDDILVRIIPNRTTVYKGEPIRVQLKIYTRVDLAGVQNARYPAFNGFWSQEINTVAEWRQETYNNKLYNTQVVREFLIFPQQAGTLSIEQFALSVVARIVTQGQRQSIFDDFFGGGPSIQDIPLELAAGPIPITVRELPGGAPAGFAGAVGRFRLEAAPSLTEIPANSSADFKITISGSGNLPLIEAPSPTLPTSFEAYTATTADNYAPDGANITGGKTFSIPFIPRAEGEYTIAPLEFSYFDPATGRYQTLSTQGYTVHIGKDAGGGNAATGLVGGVNREELKILSEDIRFIRLGDPGLRRSSAVLLWSWKYWAILLLLVGAFVSTLSYLRKQIRLRGDATLVRNRRAQKAALRRLRTAESFMRAGDSGRFYDEMLKALWGYMGDKLNLPAADLSRDRLQEALAARGVGPELTEGYIAAIAECEYRRYAPADKSQIGDVYHNAVELISKIESKI